MLHNINQQISSIKADDETKNAILQLIDLKTDNDMKEILTKMDGFNQRMENIKTEMQAEMKSFNKEIKILYWVIGAGVALLTIIISLKK